MVAEWCRLFEWAETAQAMAADDGTPALADHGGERKQQGSNTTLKPGRGAEYLVRRLKRDAPHIAEKLARGECRSARQAAIAAGIVKVPPPGGGTSRSSS
jgi:hypothetical protein